MSSKHIASAISKKNSNCWSKSITSAFVVRDYCPFLVRCFNYGILNQQKRSFSAKPRFDFGHLRDPDDAISLFHEMVRMRDPIPSVVDFTKLLSVVVKIKQYDLALSLFDEMLQQNAPINHYTLTIVINCFCPLQCVDYGFAIMGIQIKRGYEPPMVTHNSLIDGYCLRGEMDEAKRIWDLAVNSGLKLDIVSHSSLINGYCKKGCMNEAWRLFLKIHAKGLQPNIVTYTTMLQGLFREGRCEDGLKLFKEMQVRKFVS